MVFTYDRYNYHLDFSPTSKIVKSYDTHDRSVYHVRIPCTQDRYTNHAKKKVKKRNFKEKKRKEKKERKEKKRKEGLLG